MKQFNIKLYIGVICIILIISDLRFRKVDGDGMATTISDAKTVVLSRSKLAISGLNRSTIVEFRRDVSPSNIGRIIALPSESVRVENGNLYIDDNESKWRLIEEYLPAGTYTTSYNRGKWIKLGKFEYLILQDNKRTNINLSEMIINQNNVQAAYIGKF